jgi:hypothetical protein
MCGATLDLVSAREGMTADTRAVLRDNEGMVWGTMPMATFLIQIPCGIKETDTMMRSLLSVTSILDGHHKKNKVSSNLQNKISVIYEMESRTRACGDIEWAKLLMKM